MPNLCGPVQRGPMQRLARVMLAREQATTNVLTQKHFSVAEVAVICGMDKKTVRQWLCKGKLKGWRIGHQGQWRVNENEVNRLTSGMTAKIPKTQGAKPAQET
jgi:excisionase family DNA binding protein